jgi:hypothetical protein
MLRKHSILLGIIISLILLIVATMHYPGGSQYDKHSIGFDWKNNYICNLFSKQAMNGVDSASPPWAIGGMLVFCISFLLFFIEFSKKISSKGAARVIRYFGAGGMVCAFLIVTPYHDIMVTLSGTLVLVSMFYITVFIFKSKLQFFKVLSLVCLTVFYSCNYIYYTGHYLAYLPVMQKIAFGLCAFWILSLHYFTTVNDFQRCIRKADGTPDPADG